MIGGDSIGKNVFRRLTDAAGKDAGIDTFDSFLLKTDASGEVFIKGCKRLLLCFDTRLDFDCGDRIVSVIGADLSLKMLSPNDTRVGGSIASISFVEVSGEC